MLWKEWRETRWKWLAFAGAFHIPAIIGGLVVAFKENARFDLMTLNDGAATQVLQVTLIAQTIFLVTAGLFLLAFYAVGAVGAEIENRSVFFLLERPVRRWHVLAFKFTIGAVQTVTCVGLSILTTLALVYFLMVAAASGVTFEGSWSEFVRVATNALRGTLWTGVIALMVFSATFLFSVLFEKWWVAVIAGAISLIAMFYFWGEKLLEVVVSRMVRNSHGQKANLEFYGNLEPLPIIWMLLVTAGLYLAAQYIFARKEMK